MFVPEVVTLSTPPSNSASSVESLYFEVTGGSEWVKITDLEITTATTTHLQVYARQGNAVPYEKTPCAWQLVAETAE